MSMPLRLRRAVQQRYMLARAWHSKGAIPVAMAGYREALAMDPGHLESAVMLGSLLQSQLRLEEALEHYKQALEHNPKRRSGTIVSNAGTRGTWPSSHGISSAAPS
jgi:tetratricopeptide (TPR) repeat protein